MSQPAGPEPDPRAAASTAAVLVGVDGSEASLAAIELAAREAGYREAPLIAVRANSGERPLGAPAAWPVASLHSASLHSASLHSANLHGANLHGANLPSAIQHSVEGERMNAEASLRDAVREALGDQADLVEVHAVLGLAGRKIVETAQRVNAQLIVLATHGSASLLLGTVSQYVLRKAPCPVLIVPAQPARL
jgi:nucleotide-binding universal stress UspA family protein